MKKLALLLAACMVPALFHAHSQPVVRLGAEALLDNHLGLLKGKRIGVVANHSALLSNGTHLVDTLLSLPDITVTALFGPEHGFRGNAPAGEKITHATDAATGIPVYSLYGANRKPTKEMLEKVDILIFDIQDVGARFYTYLSTLALCIEAAGEHGKCIMVLDRPNPIGGRTEGFIRDDSLKSFVAHIPVPVTHGMTLGELAMMMSAEEMIPIKTSVQMKVIKMKGWKREMFFDETGLTWIPPSPNLPTFTSALVYPGTCLLEGTNISEGRGTETPFEMFGAPFINGDSLAAALNALQLPGVSFSPATFTPVDIPGKALDPKHEGALCGGCTVTVTDKNALKPYAMGVAIIATLHDLYPGKFQWRSSFDRLTGTPRVREHISQKKPLGELLRAQEEESRRFDMKRAPYLAY